MTAAQTTTGTHRARIALYSRQPKEDGGGTPGKTRDGPAAVRGDALHQTPLSERSGRRWRGSPESEDLPVALQIEPLAEGGFVAKRLILLIVLCLALPATALAATVKVRVEGKTKTLFAPTEITVTASTPMEAIEQASFIGELYYHVTHSSFGDYVDQVGRYGGSAEGGWGFKVNDVSPPGRADKVTLKDGDRVLWYYAKFGPPGRPPQLYVKGSAACYAAPAFDDNGKPA